MIDIMVIRPEKREEFHQNWEKFEKLMKKTGMIKSTKLWVDGFGGLLLEPLSAYKYYAMTEFENIAANEEMHRKLQKKVKNIGNLNACFLNNRSPIQGNAF